MKQGDKESEPFWVWIALIGIAYIVYMGDGQVRIFGMFYVEWIDLHNTTPFIASWVGFVFSIPNIVLSPFIGFMADRWSMRGIVFVSGFIGAAGMLVAAFATSIGWVILGYGILYGLSDCLSISVSLALINKYFDRHLALASGIAWCAGSIGGITMPFIIDALNYEYSSRGTLLIFAGMRLNLSLAGMVLRPVNELYKSNKNIIISTQVVSAQSPTALEHPQKTIRDQKETTHSIDNPAFLNDSVGDISQDVTPPYVSITEIKMKEDTGEQDKEDKIKTIMQIAEDKTTDSKEADSQSAITQTENGQRCCCGNVPSWVPYVFNVRFLSFSTFWFCGMMGFYGIIQYMPPYLDEFGFKDQTAMLLSVNGVADLVGRLFFAVIGDLPCTNLNAIVSISVALCGAAAILLSVTHTIPVLVVFMVIMGFNGGSLWGLCGPLVVDAIGREHAGLGGGIANSLFGVATTIAPPLIGALREATGSYQAVLYMGAAAYFVALFSFTFLGGRFPKFCRRKSSTYAVTT